MPLQWQCPHLFDAFLTLMPTSLLLLPGWMNSDPLHWQSLWEATPHDGLHIARVQQQDWDTPNRMRWMAALDQALAAAQGEVLIAAHSLGCILLGHWVAAGGQSAKIRGALLVAPPDMAHTPDALQSFAPAPVAPLPFPATLVSSRDDPYGSQNAAAELARCYGAALVDYGNRGHINTASALNHWWDGWAMLGQIARRAGLVDVIPTPTFATMLSDLPSADGIASIVLKHADGVEEILHNVPGKQGSIRIYARLLTAYGMLDTAAAAEGLRLFAEHTADAKHHPGHHPNIDRLLTILDSGQSIRGSIIL